MLTHRSFCHQFFKGQPVLPTDGVTCRYNGEGEPAYPHSGYAWATQCDVYANQGLPGPRPASTGGVNKGSSRATQCDV